MSDMDDADEAREIGFNHPDHCGMFSDDGNRAAARIIAEMKEETKAKDSDQVIYDRLTAKMNAVEPAHGEIWDTEVREIIISRLVRAWGRELTPYF